MSLNITQIKIIAKEILNRLAKNEDATIANRMQALKKSKEYADLSKLHEKLAAAKKAYEEAETTFENKHNVSCSSGKEFYVSNASGRKFSGFNSAGVQKQITHKLQLQMLRKQDVDVDALINDIIKEYE